MSTLTEVLSGLVAPNRCLHCRGPAPGASTLLCAPCRRALPWLPTDGCPRCGLPRACDRWRCPARRAAFEGAWAPLAYEGPARTLALAGKERAARRVAPWFAAAMTARCPTAIATGIAAVVPVASDPRRRRTRGEDHAALIATGVGAVLGVPVLRALARPRSAPAQHGLDRASRAGVPRPDLVHAPPRCVLLVDDVHTTGATLRTSAEVLRDGGATSVRVLTALRALR